MKFGHHFVAIAVGACALSFTAPANAYTYWTCGGTVLKFQGGGLEYEAGTNSFASENRRYSLRQALIHWNDAPSNFDFFEPEWNKGVSSSNNTSEVWYTTDSGLLDGAPARALIRWNCSIFSKKFKAVDVIMNNNVSWMNYEARTSHRKWRPNGDGYRPAQTTLMHELGHALGLAQKRQQPEQARQHAHLRLRLRRLVVRFSLRDLPLSSCTRLPHRGR